MTNRIIAFNGKAGSGKGFESDILISEGYTKYSFADGVRELGYKVLGLEKLSPEEYDKFKQTVIYNGQTFRNVLENIGENVRRMQYNFWVDLVINKIKSTIGPVCIDDLRHANEYYVVKDYCDKNNIDFKLVFCDYHSGRYQDYNPHESAALAQFLEASGYNHLQEVDEYSMKVYKTTIEDLRKY